jgi:hypothetical protein
LPPTGTAIRYRRQQGHQVFGTLAGGGVFQAGTRKHVVDRAYMLGILESGI